MGTDKTKMNFKPFQSFSIYLMNISDRNQKLWIQVFVKIVTNLSGTIAVDVGIIVECKGKFLKFSRNISQSIAMCKKPMFFDV